MTSPCRSRLIAAKLITVSNVQRVAIASPSVPERLIRTYPVDQLRSGSGVQNAISVGVADDVDLDHLDGLASGSRPFLSARRDERPRTTQVPGEGQRALLGPVRWIIC